MLKITLQIYPWSLSFFFLFFFFFVIIGKLYGNVGDFPCKCTDTWGQLVLLTTILNHETCINTSRQVLEKTLFAINAIFTQ